MSLQIEAQEYVHRLASLPSLRIEPEPPMPKP